MSCKAVKMESESRGDFPGDELGVCKVKKELSLVKCEWKLESLVEETI